jgi:hypothetical protein
VEKMKPVKRGTFHECFDGRDKRLLHSLNASEDSSNRVWILRGSGFVLCCLSPTDSLTLYFSLHRLCLSLH